MTIELKKFGTTLISRQLGREAFLAFQPALLDLQPAEKISIEFEGVTTLTPSWADEFLTPLIAKFPSRIQLRKSDNPSVHATLAILEKSASEPFIVIP
ncbi:MAG: hypothetical protein COU06_02895 [Candidatus Harrisonbacteria bacterium CG10_big_fil_rev_8_21_14_0_10_38_8]|uniref:DUF4325 domain-containing protein n=1 Tax=Candidatus Harrisonbacteria bacterium CG10_big_fil_rev_8_21_14_0_10_38_8 TaxID=1974582 RepID=A0A2M6WJI9_9BACT|nr:MAG: hypothetical protein COU06_02895 [Candidatus Harrisonbacteria bacterium CG10_big_fil_rev_8_21_14_0_10_38_8]